MKDNEGLSIPTSGHSWRMTRYLPGVSVTRFASFLALTTLMITVIVIIGALGMLLAPLVNLEPQQPFCYSDLCGKIFLAI